MYLEPEYLITEHGIARLCNTTEYFHLKAASPSANQVLSLGLLLRFNGG